MIKELTLPNVKEILGFGTVTIQELPFLNSTVKPQINQTKTVIYI